MKSVFSHSVMFKIFTAFVAVALVLAILPVSPAYAATLTVTNTADDLTNGNGCSLREAIANANADAATYPDCPAGTGADTIILTSGSTYTLLPGGTATTGDIDIGDADGLTIQASSTTPAIIDANDVDRVIQVTAGNLTLNYIKVTNGNATGGSTGGGIMFGGTGTLTVNNSTVSSNIATNAAGCGGGIFNNTAATIVITNSTVEGNSCSVVGSDGGGLWKGTGGTLTIRNSTFYNNFTDDDGGGLRMTNGTGTISFSTFSNNSTSNSVGNIGGAVQVSGGTLSITSSILANSTANANQNDCYQSGTGVVTLTNTSVEVVSNCGGTVFSAADPGLGTFQNNGGPTNTLAITNGSIAFNAATSCGAFTNDQRGYPRPQKSTDNCDLGAFELQVNDEPSFTTGGNVTVLEDSGAYSAAWATAISDGDTELIQTLTFNMSNNNNALFSAQPSVNPTGTLTFTPAANANGSATVSVYLTDDGGIANGGDDTSPTVNFTITVTAVNDEPDFTASNPAAVNEDAGVQSVSSWATFNPGPPNEAGQSALQYNILNSTCGTLLSAGPSVNTAGTLTYTPTANQNGTCTFDVQVQDNGGTANGGDDTSPTHNFTITVNAQDDPPTAVGDSVTVAEDAAATTIDVLSNDTDTDGGLKTIISVTQPANGTVVITNAGADLTYQPNANYCNDGVPTDDFTYTLNGGSTATVAVTVTCADDPPTAVGDSVTVAEDAAATTIDVLSNDTDTDGGLKTIISVTQPANGTVVITNAGADLTYQPNANYCNDGVPTDDFTYTLNGGSTATVTITVDCINDAPSFTASNPPGVTVNSGAQSVNSWATFNAGPNEAGQGVLQYNISASTCGTLLSTGPSVSTAGTLTYTPATDQVGTCTFDVTVQDDGGTTNGGVDTSSPAQTFTIAVKVADTTTTITSDTPDPSVVGQPVTVNYTVAVIAPGAGTPTGNVTVSDGTQSCTGTVAAGSCSITFTSVGAKTLTATYAGDTNFNGSTSATAAHTVNLADTTTTITSDTPDPSVVDQTVTVNYTVAVIAPGAGTPTGNVTVSDGTQSCTGTVAAGSCSITFTSVGAKTLTATYAGDTNFNGSTSATAAHTVNLADTTTTITSDTPDPSAGGQAVTVQYSVAVTAPGTGTPTGNVTVSDGVDSCTATVAAGQCSISLTTNGLRTLTATYAGDTNFNGSTSAGEPHTVDANAPTVTVDQATGQADPTNASPITFTAVFSKPINTATFIDTDVTLGGTALGTLSAIITEVAPNDGTTFNIAVSGMTSSGTVIASIAANTVQDPVGNNNTASTSTDNVVTYDSGNPSVISTNLTASYTGTGPGSFVVTFSEAVDDPAGNTGTDDVTNVANYLLVNKGTNGIPNTASCAGSVVADDTNVTVTSIVYNNATFQSTVTLASPLPVGSYRLFICGTTSIVDLSGNPLNGGTDYTFDFVVQAAATQSVSGSLPATGFPMHEVTSLPFQPANLAYTSYSDMWLEIPSLGVKMSIVGVPSTKGGWNVTWLNKDAGWLNGSAYPTWSGNSVLTGHVWDALNQPGPFANLKNLKYGDQIRIHAFGQVYIYEVRENRTVLPTSISTVFKHEEKSWITLLTCEDYKETSQSYSYRRMIRAVLISVISE